LVFALVCVHSQTHGQDGFDVLQCRRMMEVLALDCS